MTPENHAAQREGDSQTPGVLITKNSDAARDVTVITPRGVLKFALFFIACVAFALLLVGLYLGYFGRIVTR
jgi:hypothetical protein